MSLWREPDYTNSIFFSMASCQISENCFPSKWWTVWAHFSQRCCIIICGWSAETLQRRMSSSAHSRCLNFPPRVTITQPPELSCSPSVVLLAVFSTPDAGVYVKPSFWRKLLFWHARFSSCSARPMSSFQERKEFVIKEPDINTVQRLIGTVSRSCLWMSDTRSLWCVRSLDWPEPKYFLKCSQAHTCVLCLCIPVLHICQWSGVLRRVLLTASARAEWDTLSIDCPLEKSCTVKPWHFL